MPKLIKFIFIFVLFTSQGCESLKGFKFPLLSDSTKHDNKLEQENKLEQDEIYLLLKQSNQYSHYPTDKKKTLCNRLKLAYKKHNNWKTAWFIAYSFNDSFNCVSLKKKRVLLEFIKPKIKESSPLYSVNLNQIKLLKKLSYLQSNNKKIKSKYNSLKIKLNKTETELQTIISKIQALKVIETTINKKTLR